MKTTFASAAAAAFLIVACGQAPDPIKDGPPAEIHRGIERGRVGESSLSESRPEETAAPRTPEGEEHVEVTVRVVFGGDHTGGWRPPVPGVLVTLHDADTPDGAMPRGVTNEKGEVTLTLPGRSLFSVDYGFGSIFAKLESSGYWSAEAPLRREGTEGKYSYGAILETSRGWARKVFVEGTSLESEPARVWVAYTATRPASTADQDPSVVTDRRSRVLGGAGGEYEVSLQASKAERWILVDGGRDGWASHRIEGSVPGFGVDEPIRIRLRGEAKMVGRIVGGQGELAAGVGLRATRLPDAAPTTADAPQDASMEPMLSALAIRGEGQFMQETQTSGSGEYTFEGLMAGRYRIDAIPLTTDKPWWDAIPLGEGVASVDPPPRDLTFKRPTIIVKVDRGPTNKSCDLLLYDAGPAGSLPWARPRLSKSPLPVPNHLARQRIDRSRPPYAHGTPGVFVAEWDRQYFLVVRGEGYDPSPRLLSIPRGEFVAEARVGPPGASQMGTLKIKVALEELEARSPNHPFDSMPSDYGVTVEHAESGVPLSRLGSKDFVDGEALLAVPAGKVRVVASGVPTFSRVGVTTLVAPQRYGRTAKVLRVQANGVTDVAMGTTVSGGRLEISTKGRLSAADLTSHAELRERYKYNLPHTSPEALNHSIWAVLEIENTEGRMLLPVLRTAPNHSGYDILDGWPVGETQTSETLPPGTHTLRATFPGRDPIEVSVTITDGETTKVELDFGT